jgi:hypothetical protein
LGEPRVATRPEEVVKLHAVDYVSKRRATKIPFGFYMLDPGPEPSFPARPKAAANQNQHAAKAYAAALFARFDADQDGYLNQLETGAAATAVNGADWWASRSSAPGWASLCEESGGADLARGLRVSNFERVVLQVRAAFRRKTHSVR